MNRDVPVSSVCHPYAKHKWSNGEVKVLDDRSQLEVVSDWFSTGFANPVVVCSCDTRKGDFRYINSAPNIASEVLEKFGTYRSFFDLEVSLNYGPWVL